MVTLLVFQEVRLKVAILEFITVAVETQPGLTELFLDLQTDETSTNQMVQNPE